MAQRTPLLLYELIVSYSISIIYSYAPSPFPPPQRSGASGAALTQRTPPLLYNRVRPGATGRVRPAAMIFFAPLGQTLIVVNVMENTGCFLRKVRFGFAPGAQRSLARYHDSTGTVAPLLPDYILFAINSLFSMTSMFRARSTAESGALP